MLTKFPPHVKQNATIGLICPAGGFVDYKPIDHVVKYLKKNGYKVKVGKSIIASSKDYKYLSGSDSERLSDFHNFWMDKKIDAIFCLRGGYGSLRLLNDIDFNLIKKTKKIILGFSDITILLLAIYARCNLITFHGPLIGYKFIDKNLNLINPANTVNMWNLLKNPKFIFSYSYKSRGIVIKPGKAIGHLVGGNLTDICSMIGSSYLPDFKNTILFLEDCYEEPYKIDRLLTQLSNAKVFDKVNALIFSSFYKSNFKSNKQIVSLLKDKVLKYNVPTVFNFPIGHGDKNYTVPIGINASFDTSSLTLQRVL